MMFRTDAVGAEARVGGSLVFLLPWEPSGVCVRRHVLLMKRTQSNIAPKPLRAQRCTSITSIILLLSYSNFHCLAQRRRGDTKVLLV